MATVMPTGHGGNVSVTTVSVLGPGSPVLVEVQDGFWTFGNIDLSNTWTSNGLPAIRYVDKFSGKEVKELLGQRSFLADSLARDINYPVGSQVFVEDATGYWMFGTVIQKGFDAGLCMEFYHILRKNDNALIFCTKDRVAKCTSNYVLWLDPDPDDVWAKSSSGDFLCPQPKVNMKRSKILQEMMHGADSTQNALQIATYGMLSAAWLANDLDKDGILNAIELDSLKKAVNNGIQWVSEGGGQEAFEMGIKASEAALEKCATGAQFICAGFADPEGLYQGLSETTAQVVATVGAFVDRFGGGDGGTSAADVQRAIVAATNAAGEIGPEVVNAIEGAMICGLSAAPGAVLALGETLKGVALEAQGLIPAPVINVCNQIWDGCLEGIVDKVAGVLRELVEVMKPAAVILAGLAQAAAATVSSAAAFIIPELKKAVIAAAPIAGEAMMFLQAAMGEVASALATHGPVAIAAIKEAMATAAGGAFVALNQCAVTLEAAWAEVEGQALAMAGGAADGVKAAYEAILNSLREAQAAGAAVSASVLSTLQDAVNGGYALGVAWCNEIREALYAAAAFLSPENLARVAEAMAAASADALKLDVAAAFSQKAFETSAAVFMDGMNVSAEAAEAALRAAAAAAQQGGAVLGAVAEDVGRAAGEQLQALVQEMERAGEAVAPELKEGIRKLIDEGTQLSGALADQVGELVKKAVGLVPPEVLAATRVAIRTAGDIAMQGSEQVQRGIVAAARSDEMKAVGGVAMAAGGVAGDAAVVALNAGQDLVNSEAVQNASQVVFDNVPKGVEWARHAANNAELAELAAQAGGICAGLYYRLSTMDIDWVQFDVIRDFFQMTALFTSQIAGHIKGFRFWGQIYSFMAIDFAFSFDVPLYVMYFALAFVAVLLLLALVYVFYTTDQEVDSFSEGHEAVAWKDRSRWVINFRVYVLSIGMFLYLPVSRSTMQVFACDKEYEKALDDVHEGAGCTTKAGILVIVCSLVTIVVVGLTLPYATWSLIHKNRPRGSTEDKNITFNEQGDKVEYSDALYQADLERQMDSSDIKYNPYAFLYYGYERDTAYYKLIVMILKTIVCLPVVFLATHPRYQASFTLAVLVVWGFGSYWFSPFIENSADQLDLVSRGSQFLTVFLAAIALYDEDATDFAAVTVTLVNILSLLLLIILLVRSTRYYAVWMKDFYGTLTFKSYNTKTRFQTSVNVTQSNIDQWKKDSDGDEYELIPLKWDLHKETKTRIWHRFWDGFFMELRKEFEKDPKHEAHGMADRFDYFREQVKDVGVGRIMRWRLETHPTVLWARDQLVGMLEGIDVYVGKECLLADNNLIKIEGTNASKTYDSKTGFAKVYVEMFPLRAMVVYDDCEDRAILYDPSITRVCEMNLKDPEIMRRRRVRRKLRAMSRAAERGELSHYPFSEWRNKKVPDGTETVTDSEGKTTEKKKYKTVPVEIHFTKGTVRITQGKKPILKTYNGITIDTSAGFHFSMSYCDGHGETTEGEGATFHGETASVGGEHIGLTDEFADTSELDKFFDLNQDQWSFEQMDCYEQAWLDYREELNDERGIANSKLTDRFWPDIYNDAEMTRTKMVEIMKGEPLLNKFTRENPTAYNYVWSRMDFVQGHPSLCYWFVFWDDFWEENWDMTILKGKEDIFGPNSNNSIMYKCMNRTELEALLSNNGLLSNSNYFFPALLDKLYVNLNTATWTLHTDSWRNHIQCSYVPWSGGVTDPGNLNMGAAMGAGMMMRTQSTMDRFEADRELARQLADPDAGAQNMVPAQDGLEAARRLQEQERLQQEAFQRDLEMARQLSGENGTPDNPPPPPPTMGDDMDLARRMAEEDRLQQEAFQRDLEIARQLSEDT